MTDRIELTARQQRVLDFITQYRRKKGFSPSIRDICGNFGFGPRAGHDYVQVLKKKGYITYEEKIPRSIVVL